MKSIDTLVDDMYSVIQGEGGWEEYHTKIIGDAIGEAAKRRFSEPSRPNNTLRMSSIGKPCERELYYDVNHDHALKEEMEPWTLWKFFYGDMIEEAALAVARAAGHTVQGEQEEVEISGIKGHCDAIIDGMLIDVKSCSPFAFKKFKENGLREDDPFGYIYIACLEGEHGTSAASHAPVEIVLRVGLQAGIANLEAVRLEKGGNAHGVSLLLLHADTKGLDTTEKEPRIEGRKSAA